VAGAPSSVLVAPKVVTVWRFERQLIQLIPSAIFRSPPPLFQSTTAY
jgi:hypothetical protein